MKKKTILMVCVILAAITAPAFALGPVDVEAGVSYWLSETTISAWDESDTYDSDELSFWGQIWVKKWGAKGAIYRVVMTDNDIEGTIDIDFTSLELRYKILAVTENNYLALGIGYQSISWDEAGFLSTDSTGWRLSAEGHFGLGKIVNIYGEAGYFVGMGDFSYQGEDIFLDPSGMEFEVGISIKPFPFFNLRAGYRQSTVDFDLSNFLKEEAPVVNAEFQPEGFTIGASFNF